MIKCGACELQITPPLGLSIPGYFENRISEGIKDELYVKSLVLDDGEAVIAFITLDAVGIYKQDVNDIRDRVSCMTGIPTKNIMVSATHIHTGPPVANTFENKRDEEYMALLVKKAADSGILAYKNRKPSRIGFGLGEEDSISFNRRFFMKDGSVRTNPGIANPLIEMPAGPIDPDVCVMRIEDESGLPLAIVTNFACHPDVVGGNEYCGDYPGELSRVLKRVYGQNVVSLFFTGACGNINHIDASGKTKAEIDHYKKMGKILAGEVININEKIVTGKCIKLDVNSASFVSKTRLLDGEVLRKAEALINQEDANPVEKLFAKEAIIYAQDQGNEILVEVQAVKVGDLSVLALPGEIFVELGLEIKKNSLFKFNMINTLANARYGYIPTLEAFQQGGYEPKTTRVNRLVPEAGIKMVNIAQELLKKLY